MSAEDEVIIGFYSESKDGIVHVGIVREVESPISVQASDTISRDSSDNGEYSSDENLSIGLDRYSSDLVSGDEGDVGIECCIQSSIGVQTSEEISPCSCDSGEGSSDEDFSVGLYSRGIDDIVHVRISEGRVEGSGSIDSSDTITSDSGDSGEGSGEDDAIG